MNHHFVPEGGCSDRYHAQNFQSRRVIYRKYPLIFALE